MNLKDYLGQPIFVNEIIDYPNRPIREGKDNFLYLMDLEIQTTDNNSDIEDYYTNPSEDDEFVSVYVIYQDEETTTESKYRVIPLDKFEELVEYSNSLTKRNCNFKWSAR